MLFTERCERCWPDLWTCLSSPSSAQTHHLSGTFEHLRKNCYLCISVSLKYSTFHWPRDAVLLCAAETTCEGGSATHSIPSPLYCSFSPPLCSSSLLVWYHFTGSPDFPESQRGHVTHLLTSLPLEPNEFSSDMGLRLPAVILTSHLLKTETKREKVSNLVKVKRHVTEESWLTSSCTCRTAHLTLMVE